ncbi:hypothetical protein CVT26_002462 [Gymnopilus dilepis]|uniref:Uncharacterized protein n=1 Tax=Gymnopilus dilepis TaxID=231916 RepID=A0A409VT59_9AGAR|nr:hypothetical protein CVT26_002462 [Gymnopilus dilepis]
MSSYEARLSTMRKRNRKAGTHDCQMVRACWRLYELPQATSSGTPLYDEQRTWISCSGAGLNEARGTREVRKLGSFSDGRTLESMRPKVSVCEEEDAQEKIEEGKELTSDEGVPWEHSIGETN